MLDRTALPLGESPVPRVPLAGTPGVGGPKRHVAERVSALCFERRVIGVSDGVVALDLAGIPFAGATLQPQSMPSAKRKVHSPTSEYAQRAAALCLDLKANDVVILSLRGVSDMADFFVIASGTSDTHVRSSRKGNGGTPACGQSRAADVGVRAPIPIRVQSVFHPWLKNQFSWRNSALAKSARQKLVHAAAWSAGLAGLSPRNLPKKSAATVCSFAVGGRVKASQ